MADALFRNVDCIRLAVTDLDSALEFYRDRLGHALVWRNDAAAGLSMPESETELVVHLEADRGASLLVTSVDAAVARFEAAGGAVIEKPFDIAVGRCAVVADPWNNVLVLLDLSKGTFVTDASGRVIGTKPAHT